MKYVLLVALILLTGCTSTPESNGTQLSASEVQSVFIDRPWRSPSGRFLFKSDGTYTFFGNNGQVNPSPWNYTLRPDGVIEGATTNYTFFRKADGSYVYHHSRSNRRYRVLL